MRERISRVPPGSKVNTVRVLVDGVFVAIAKMGHRPAFDELHRRHAEKMLYLVGRINRHHEEAEDAVHGAAARLGMKRTTLIARMRKHGIFRPAEDSNLNQAVHSD